MTFVDILYITIIKRERDEFNLNFCIAIFLKVVPLFKKDFLIIYFNYYL